MFTGSYFYEQFKHNEINFLVQIFDFQVIFHANYEIHYLSLLDKSRIYKFHIESHLHILGSRSRVILRSFFQSHYHSKNGQYSNPNLPSIQSGHYWVNCRHEKMYSAITGSLFFSFSYLIFSNQINTISSSYISIWIPSFPMLIRGIH
jgi:hypothetical protein